MSWSYDFANNPRVAYVRLLIPDTAQSAPIFSDEEIGAFYQIQASQFQTSMFYSAPAGANLPSSPVSYLRVAALALDTLANNSARLASVTQLLDVKLSPGTSAKSLREAAAAYRATDDDAGAFAIIEQVNSTWNLRDRFFSQIQRQLGGWGP